MVGDSASPGPVLESSKSELDDHDLCGNVNLVREANVQRREEEIKGRQRERLEKKHKLWQIVQESAAARKDELRESRFAKSAAKARQSRLRELENDYKERCREVKIVARQQVR
ncbi:hypothetical protein FOZ63_026602, partial [Perkinsus olseni]